MWFQWYLAYKFPYGEGSTIWSAYLLDLDRSPQSTSHSFFFVPFSFLEKCLRALHFHWGTKGNTISWHWSDQNNCGLEKGSCEMNTFRENWHRSIQTNARVEFRQSNNRTHPSESYIEKVKYIYKTCSSSLPKYLLT